MSLRTEEETPSLTEIMEEMIEDRLYSLNTMMPGTIRSVDKARCLVSVQPDFLRVYRDDEGPVEYPVIEGVPLWELRADNAKIRMPVKTNGKCMLLFSQRALERWKATGGFTRPGDTRLHALSDAVCIPGLYPIASSTPLTDELSIEFGSATIKIKESELITVKVLNAVLEMNKDGKFKISNGTSEFLDLVKQLIEVDESIVDAITKATFPTALGPTGTVIDPIPFVTGLKDLAAIRKKLSQLILG